MGTAPDLALFRTAETRADGILVWSDWLEEQGRTQEAAALRECPELVFGQIGFSEGSGYGDGSGSGSGDGYG